jgi:glucan phosphoethanolaminetransferase (alkaline phosphatase superfamily)
MPLVQPTTPAGRPVSPNTVLWGVFALTEIVVGSVFVLHVHRRLGVDAGLGLAGLVTRTALYVSIGLLIEALLLRTAGGYLTLTRPRRTWIHLHAVVLLLLTVALIVDLFVFAFAGYHLTTALRILFSDGPQGVGKVVEATGLPASVAVGGAVGLAVALGLAVVLSKATRRLSSRRPVVVSRRAALVGIAVSVAVLAIVETAGYRVRNPFLWEREVKSVPLAFAILRPPAELASFQVSVHKPDTARRRALAAGAGPIARKPDLFFVIVESLRKDIVTAEVMPRLKAFGDQSWTFEHADTTGNVTHFSWYGLLCGSYPLFFNEIKKVPEEQGSVPLETLRRLGYRIRLFATPDTAYQNLESLVFGPGANLLATKFHPPERLPAERDSIVVDELARVMGKEPHGGTAYIMALDSTHYDYAWGPGYKPRFEPYAADASIARDYEHDAVARAALFNRYKSSAAWMDTLLGRFFDALQSSGRMDDSVVVVTGDHGEAFWEHGSGTHGSDLGAEQLDVGFVLRLPGQAARHFDAVFSLLDVMPTVFSELGVDAASWMPGVPVQKRRTGPDDTLAPRSALTFQGWSSQAFRFALTEQDRRVVLELDRPNPLEAHRLVIKDITDMNSAPVAFGDSPDAPRVYHQTLRELPALFDAMPFLDL